MVLLFFVTLFTWLHSNCAIGYCFLNVFRSNSWSSLFCCRCVQDLDCGGGGLSGKNSIDLVDLFQRLIEGVRRCFALNISYIKNAINFFCQMCYQVKRLPIVKSYQSDFFLLLVFGSKSNQNHIYSSLLASLIFSTNPTKEKIQK